MRGEAEWVGENKNDLRAPYCICYKPMRFSGRDENWEEARRVLYEAFRGWCHAKCGK